MKKLHKSSLIILIPFLYKCFVIFSTDRESASGKSACDIQLYFENKIFFMGKLAHFAKKQWHKTLAVSEKPYILPVSINFRWIPKKF
jgi:hypothetical protein